MSERNEDLRERLHKLADEAVEATVKWEKAHPERSFDEIESYVLGVRRRFGQQIAQVLSEYQTAQRPVPGPSCPRCGREMHYKGPVERTVGSLVGPVEVERSYYHCDLCEQGIFPPG